MGEHYTQSTETRHTHSLNHTFHFSFGFIYFMAKITFDLETSSEFFVGNLNKTKTRDEIFQDLTKIKIDCLDGEHLYISKFNMPKFNARKDNDGKLLLNLGYAFVTTLKPEMAQELIEKKRMKLEDGSDIEFKPINKSKRLVANQNCKEKNISKINDVNGTRKNNSFGAIGDWRNQQSVKTSEMNSKSLFGDLDRAPASIKQNDRQMHNMSFEQKQNSTNFLWQPFEEKYSDDGSSQSNGSSQYIFDIPYSTCKYPPVNDVLTERSQNGSFQRRSIYSTGSDV